MIDPNVPRYPFWQVQAVFDPDGHGGDFSYTIGLAQHDVPELHLWGRPSLGDDPGEDWVFSMHDTARVLNELAWQWLEGELCVGDTFEREYDDGLVRVCFRVDPPQDAESLEAYGAGESPVVPIRWSLHRPAIAPARGMDPAQEMAATALWDRLSEELDSSRSGPHGWRLPARPAWALQQRWGPRTPLVLARAAQLWQADAIQLGGVVQVGLYVDAAGSLTYPCSVAFTAARSVGRQRRLQRLSGDVGRLLEGLGERWAIDEFAVVERDLMGVGTTAHERRRNRNNLRGLVRDSLSSALAVECVADVLPDRTMLQGQGPLLAGLVGPGQAPGPQWVAAPAVVQAARELLSGVAPAALVRLAREHVRRREGSTDAAYEQVFMWLSARAATGPAGCPDILELVSPRDRVATAFALGVNGPGIGMLQEWATALTAALVHRLELDHARTRAFVEPFEHLLPGLSRLVHEPIVGAA